MHMVQHYMHVYTAYVVKHQRLGLLLGIFTKPIVINKTFQTVRMKFKNNAFISKNRPLCSKRTS